MTANMAGGVATKIQTIAVLISVACESGEPVRRLQSNGTPSNTYVKGMAAVLYSLPIGLTARVVGLQ